VKPHRMVTRLINRHLEQRGLFRAIMLELDQERPRYEMTGTLEAIEELDSGNEWYAHLAFSLRLSSGDRTVWSHRSDARKRVYNRAPVYVIQALSELLEAELEKISASLAERLKSEPAEKGP